MPCFASLSCLPPVLRPQQVAALLPPLTAACAVPRASASDEIRFHAVAALRAVFVATRRAQAVSGMGGVGGGPLVGDTVSLHRASSRAAVRLLGFAMTVER